MRRLIEPWQVAAFALGEVQRRGGESGDRPLHVRSAAPIQHAVLDLAGERRMAPLPRLARRHHIAMAGEAKMRVVRADAGIEIVDRGRSLFFEGEAMAAEAALRESPFKHVQGAGLERRHAGAAD